MRNLIWLLFLPFLAHAANLSEVNRQQLFPKNLLSNGGFENGKGTSSTNDLWTASGGSFAIATSGSDKLVGKASATWDSNASSQTLSTSSIPIPNGLLGRAGVGYCLILTASGTSTHLLEVTDGTNILSSDAIVSSSQPIRNYTSFVFPTSGNVVLRLKSVASNEPSITIDECFLGAADGITLQSLYPMTIFTAHVNGSVSPSTVSKENVDWINGNCTRSISGLFQCTYNGGIFSTAPNCYGSYSNSSGGTDVGILNFTTNSSSTQFEVNLRNGAGTALNQEFDVTCQKTSVDTPQTAYKISTVATSWSGYHDNTCSWARTNTAYGDPTADATCALAERTNNNFGTVSTYTVTNPEPGIVFTPKRAGRYWVCANFKIAGSNLAAVLDVRLWDGTTTIAEYQTQETVATDVVPGAACGIYVATSTASVTLSLQTKASAGSVTIAASGATNASAVEWSVVSIDQNLPAPVFQNAVVTPTTNGVRIATARLNCDSASSIIQQDGSWISSIGNISAGACAVTIAGSTFTQAPVCTVTEETGAAGDPLNIGFTTAPTTTALSVDAATNAGTDATAFDFELICIGTK